MDSLPTPALPSLQHRMVAARRLSRLHTHVAPGAKGLLGGSLTAEDLMGGSGFTDAVGLTEAQKAEQPATRREELQKTIEELGLQDNCRELDEEGCEDSVRLCVGIVCRFAV